MNILFSILACFGILSNSPREKDPLISTIDTQVKNTIEHSETVPGLNADEFNSLKAGITDRWEELVNKGVIEITATDKEVRPYFVALQGMIEHVLSKELNRQIKSLTGVIHTPMPATPLCTKGEISKELVDPSIEKDPLRLFTVNARTTIVRDYLYQGGDLYIAYPKDGLTKRTDLQQQIYQNELNNYSDHLFNCPLDCETIDNDLIGAFYLFKNAEGKTFGFAIKMTQANDPQDQASFGIWFGEMKDTPIHNRIFQVLEMLQQHSLQFTHLTL